MATIQQSIAITDGVTPQFQKMAKAAEATTGKFEKAAAAANRIEDAVPHKTVVQIENIGAAAYSAVGGFNAASAAVNHFENNLQGISGGFNRIRDAMSSTLGKFTLVSIAVMAITQVISLLKQAASNLTKLSDEYSGIVARIKLITNSAAEATAMNDQIYYSALRARGSYAGMADAVSKIGLTAKEAFPDPQAIVPFVENIQKLFAVGGTGIQQQKDAMLQLTQALGSGRLQGDEFRTIAEAAPMIGQIVAKYMHVTQGELKELSSKGEITAEIMKNAILGATDEINAKLASMPMTWSQVWQNMQTVAFRAFVPVFNQLSAIANSPAIQSIGNAFGITAILAGQAIAGIINNLRWLGGVAIEIGGYIGSWLAAGFTILGDVANAVLPYVIGSLFAYAIGWATANAQVAVQAAIQAVVYGWTLAVTTAQRGWAGVTMILAGAQALLNSILSMNPIPILLFLIGAAVAAFLGWQISTMGLRNAIASAFSSIAGTAGGAINFMIRRVNDLIGVLNKAASSINNVFGTSIGMVATIGEVDASGWEKSAGDFVRNFDISKLGSMMGLPEMPNPNGYGGTPPIATDIANAGKDTADNTGKIKEAMEITDEDIKYLRDIAEQEVINKYTTAEVKIEMGGIHNSVSSDTDIDGMVRYLNDSLFDAMTAGAEKVHP